MIFSSDHLPIPIFKLIDFLLDSVYVKLISMVMS